jgi:hypothetical protein
MIFTYRPMQPEDILECVKIMASHPVFGPRYGRDIDLPPEAWLCLLQSEPKITAVFRSGENARAPIVGAGALTPLRPCSTSSSSSTEAARFT